MKPFNIKGVVRWYCKHYELSDVSCTCACGEQQKGEFSEPIGAFDGFIKLFVACIWNSNAAPDEWRPLQHDVTQNRAGDFVAICSVLGGTVRSVLLIARAYGSLIKQMWIKVPLLWLLCLWCDISCCIYFTNCFHSSAILGYGIPCYLVEISWPSLLLIIVFFRDTL